MNDSEQKFVLFKTFLLKKHIIHYLNNTMEDLAKKFQNDTKKNNFFFCQVNLNVTRSIDISSYLSRTIIEEPLVFKNALREVIHLKVTILLKNEKINLSQIIVTVIPTTLPNATECAVHSDRLCSFRGVLMEHTVPKKYTRGSIWECENHSDEEPYFIDGLPSKFPICTICNSDLTENVQNRSTGDLILAKFINEQALQMNKINKRYEAVNVKLTDVNSDLLELGSIYNVTGIQTQDGFEAWHCEKYHPRPTLISQLNPVRELYANLSHSPWMFTFALAMEIGSHLYCPASFMHLKLGLILSLASHNYRSNFASIPILAVGEDTQEAHHLLDCASRYASRCVLPTHGQSVLVQQRKDGWLEAGPLLLAQGGVCMLADWDKYNRAEKVGFNIRAAIETGNINLDGSNMPLRSAVWTYWHKPDKFKDKHQLQDLINVFGMPFLTDTQDNYQTDIDFLFAKHMACNNHSRSVITEAHMREFLQSVNDYDVTLNDEAQELIKDYFVVSRRIRPACLPVRALSYLTGLSEAHARLNFRKDALIEDVVAAIALYEESVQRVFGSCDYSTTPPPLKYINDITQVDSEMRTFEIWLRNYISTARMMP